MKRRRSHDTTQLHAALGIAGVVVLLTISWISYGALKGLPLQDRYRITADVPSASRLHETDDVRIAGIRVGQVAEIEPRASTPATTRLRLALEPSVRELPIDTTIAVRPASVLGATYVDLVPGTSPETVPEGGSLPARAARRTVALTDLFGLFDAQASVDLRTAVTGFGDGLTGRGSALGATIGATAHLLGPLERVTRTLALPRAGLASFLRAAVTFSAALDPVGERLASLMAGGSTT
jgi:phospholipid/cholesterol/gamma-HCH transport system substrate-binding protein